MGALDILGAGIVTTNEASKDPEEEARKAEAARHEAASDALSTAIKTEALSKGLATKFKLTHANKDDAGKRVNLLLVDQVTSTSVRLRWTRPKTRYRLDGVRIMMRESYGGQGFGSGAFTTVVEHTREPETRSRVVTSLKSDTEYEFQLAAVHDRAQKKGGAKPMIVDGTRVTSNPIRTTKATYCQAFFFEEPQEIDRLWSVFFGVLTRGGEGGANALASGDDYVLAQKLTIAQSDPKPAAPSDDDPHPRPCCLTGRQCLVLNLPGGLSTGPPTSPRGCRARPRAPARRATRSRARLDRFVEARRLRRPPTPNFCGAPPGVALGWPGGKFQVRRGETAPARA